jgi:hypothetical protein
LGYWRIVASKWTVLLPFLFCSAQLFSFGDSDFSSINYRYSRIPQAGRSGRYGFRGLR